METKFSKKDKAPETSRTDAFRIDKHLYPEKIGNTWSVFGDKTGFCYREGMDKESADKYAEELNQNRRNLVD